MPYALICNVEFALAIFEGENHANDVVQPRKLLTRQSNTIDFSDLRTLLNLSCHFFFLLGPSNLLGGIFGFGFCPLRLAISPLNCWSNSFWNAIELVSWSMTALFSSIILRS